LKKALRILLIILIFLTAFLFQQTNTLKTTEYTWQSSRVPRAFDGYRVVQVSDLHNKRFGKKQERLIKAIKGAEPDMIALTGDIIDESTESLEPARELLEGMRTLAPLYYTDGNHDPNSPFYRAFRAMLREYDVTVLDRNVDVIEHDGETMYIAGYAYWSNKFDNAEIAASDLILCHGPNAFPFFAEMGCGLVLAGHNHGGQVALPGGRAVFIPREGFFPGYSYGVYHEGDSTMVLSRGLGTSILPLRAFAPPEIVVIELLCANQK